MYPSGQPLVSDNKWNGMLNIRHFLLLYSSLIRCRFREKAIAISLREVAGNTHTHTHTLNVFVPRGKKSSAEHIVLTSQADIAKVTKEVEGLANFKQSLPVLSNVSFDVKAGELVAIIGPVGVGKSSLLSGLLGDLYLASGKVALNGKKSYVSQTAWICNATIRYVSVTSEDVMN